MDTGTMPVPWRRIEASLYRHQRFDVRASQASQVTGAGNIATIESSAPTRRTRDRAARSI